MRIQHSSVFFNHCHFWYRVNKVNIIFITTWASVSFIFTQNLCSWVLGVQSTSISPAFIMSANHSYPDGSYQAKLEDLTRNSGLSSPVYNIVSDRRGGRTAWSSTVSVAGQTIQARFWYDGTYIQNAREDAAQVAYTQLSSNSNSYGKSNNAYASTSASA